MILEEEKCAGIITSRLARPRARSRMAKPRRRSARTTLKTAEETEETPETGVPAPADGGTSNDKCPACQDQGEQNSNSADRESWVRCDACKSWFHWRCVGQQGDLEAVDKWWVFRFTNHFVPHLFQVLSAVSEWGRYTFHQP